MRALALVGLSACATLAPEVPGEPIFVFDPASHGPALVQYAYSSGHFALVYEVYVYADRTVCFLRSRDPRRLAPRFAANSAKLADVCSLSPDRCAYPGDLGARMAVAEALAERGDPEGTIEAHIYTHPDETASLDDALALAQSRAHALKPLFEAAGVPADRVAIVPHGWMGAAERVLRSSFQPEPCGELALWEFATDEEKKARGRDDAFDFGEADREEDPAFAAELQRRCRAASERCRDTECIDSFDGLGWVEFLGDPARGQRSELAVTEPLASDWVTDIRSRVAALARSDALGDSPLYGFHIPSVSFAAGDLDVAVRADPAPAAARLLDSFFTTGVAHGCRFDTSPAETEVLRDPRSADFAPLR